ncbi:MAG: hypothetical protein C5B51_27645 [Terriglobia bacterium]|nr:MAG: hypothetical protein C5B51_27645 [Terriglobia bacterium]
MKSWSLVWNTAELSFGDITIIQVRRTGKGCLSYLVASASQAWLSMHRWTQWSTCISPSSAVGKSVTPVLLGLGTAMVYPTLIAAVADVAQPTWRASAVGVYRLWRDGGYAIGALLAGVLADLLGIPWAVGVVGGLTFLSGLIVAVVMYEPMNQRSAERASCIT